MFLAKIAVEPGYYSILTVREKSVVISGLYCTCKEPYPMTQQRDEGGSWTRIICSSCRKF